MYIVVNGKNIYYSGKELKSITDSKVVFSDGSYCDVRTGVIVNSGEGVIQIGGSDDSDDEKIKKTGPDVFDACILRLKISGCSVSVDTWDKEGIEVTKSGPENALGEISLKCSDDTLTIMEEGYSGVTRVVRWANKIVNSSVIMMGEGSSSVNIEVKVPRDTPINVDVAGSGDVDIGAVAGPLTTNIVGSGKVRAETVIDRADIRLVGCGDVEIERAKVGNLSAFVSGSGNITVGGVAADATLSVVGSGEIWVGHVKNRPSRKIVGSGDITVDRIGD